MTPTNERKLKLVVTPNPKNSYYAIWFKDFLDGMGYALDSDIAGNITINYPTWLRESDINSLISLAATVQTIPTNRQITFLTALKAEFQESQSF